MNRFYSRKPLKFIAIHFLDIFVRNLFVFLVFFLKSLQSLQFDLNNDFSPSKDRLSVTLIRLITKRLLYYNIITDNILATACGDDNNSF